MSPGTDTRRSSVSSSEPAAKVVLVRACVEVGSWRLALREPVDLSMVDALARLQLAARRLGWAVVVRDPPDDLRSLLHLVGLTMLLERAGDDPLAELDDARNDDEPADAGGSGIEVRGQPEDGEEGGLDEAVVPDDPPS
jgi:hypothetical protein